MKTKQIKQVGRVYTPKYLVNNILDLCGYTIDADILNKHILEPSSGDGAFLTEVVRRFICKSVQSNMCEKDIKEALAKYIHGIELDEVEVEKCKANLEAVANSFSIYDVAWDIECGDALKSIRHLGKISWVIGNPPYVRVHHLGVDTDFLKNNFSFARGGMTDLYIAFYELGLYMLNDTGVLGYVTPSSFFNSKAGGAMRDYITQARSIKAIVDFGHFQPFEATTYVAITLLTKQENSHIAYYLYDEETKQPTDKHTLEYGDILADDGTFLFDKDTSVYKVLASAGVQKLCIVKNGITTLLDEFFIADEFPFTKYVIPIVKASTGSQERCIFPYTKSGRLIPYESLGDNLELSKRYTEYKDRLLCRDLARGTSWHEFGRAQGIKDVYSKKYAINTLIRDEKDIKFTVCPPGTGVYGGLYILTEVPEEKLRSIILSKGFVLFVQALGKYKSGGYYTFSSKELQLYLNYKLSETKLLD